MAVAVDQAAAEQPAVEPETTTEPEPDRRPTVTFGEALVLLAVVVAGLGAWASLVLAHLGRHTLGGVALVTGGAVLALLVWGIFSRPRIRFDLRELGVLVALGAFAGIMFFPGFPYGGADKDPGVYVTHGAAIARTGDYAYDDPVLDPAKELPDTDIVESGSRFPGVWIDDEPQQVVPQFFHLYPASLATMGDLAGDDGVFDLNPALGVLSVLALTLAVRRALGWAPGIVAGALLAANMMQVWQAKYPTTEMMTQAFLSGALLAVVLAVTARWRLAAALGGLLVGLTFLARPDGLLLVLLALAGIVVLIATRRFDARAAWFTAGMAVVLPHGVLQAYRLAEKYTTDNALPSLVEVAAVGAVGLAGGLFWRHVIHDRNVRGWHRVRSEEQRARWQRRGGIAIATVVGLVLVLAAVRPELSGQQVVIRAGRELRTYNEESLLRLSWFLTIPGLVLAWGGVAVLALRRWRAPAWMLVVPGLVLLPVYLWNARIANRMMWWTRRFVPVVLVALVVLIAVAIAAALLHKGRGKWPLRIAATGAVAFLLASYVVMSWPLREHHELAGSLRVPRRIAATSPGAQGVYLWEWPRPGTFAVANLFGAPLWLAEGEISAILPKRPTRADVNAYVRAFPDQPVFVVTGRNLPRGLHPAPLEEELALSGKLPLWLETRDEPPDDSKQVAYEVRVWRWTGVGG